MTSPKKELKKLKKIPKKKLKTKFETWINTLYGHKCEFAAAMGISQSIVSFWCSGRSKPSSKYIMKIWQLSNDEIQPNYWFFEWPSEVKALKKSKLKLASKATLRNLSA